MVLIRLESLFEILSVLGKKKGFAVFSCANNQHTRDMGQGLVCLYFDKGFYPSKYILDGHPQQQASILFFSGCAGLPIEIRVEMQVQAASSPLPTHQMFVFN